MFINVQVSKGKISIKVIASKHALSMCTTGNSTLVGLQTEHGQGLVWEQDPALDSQFLVLIAK